MRLEKECNLIPEYWYYRADAANDLLIKNNNPELVFDIEQCIERYRSISGMLRKDKTLASLQMLHLSSATMTPEQAKEEIDQIVDAFPLDASKRLFAALTSLKYGLVNDAIEHLNANLDMRQYEVISRKLLSDIYQDRHEEQKVVALLEKLMKEDSISNQEKLYHLGKLSRSEKFLQELAPQLSAINLEIKPGFIGKDDIEIILPIRWELLEETALPSMLRIIGKEIPSSEKAMKDGNIRIKFKDALEKTELEGKTSVPVEAVIQTRYFPLTVVGVIKLQDNEKDQGNNISSKFIAKTKKLVNRSVGSFEIQKIQCNDSLFQREGDKWICNSTRK